MSRPDLQLAQFCQLLHKRFIQFPGLPVSCLWQLLILPLELLIDLFQSPDLRVRLVGKSLGLLPGPWLLSEFFLPLLLFLSHVGLSTIETGRQHL